MSDIEAEVHDKINTILTKQHDISSNAEEIGSNLRLLRNFCARGPIVQVQIASSAELQQFLQSLLFTTVHSDVDTKNIKQLQTIGWQLIANMSVNNHQSQLLVWKNYGNRILQFLDIQDMLNKNVDIALMIIYNVMEPAQVDSLYVLRAIVNVWQAILQQKCSEKFDFLHFIFEKFLVNNGRNTVKCYTQLDTTGRCTFLDYLNRYLQQDNPNGLVHTFILQYISKEFKLKSDCILRVSSLQEVDKMKPEEAYALLRCIASASGTDSYSELYSTDHSLFLNISSLLRCVVAASKNSENSIFSPMNKLEEVAPSSTISLDYQSEISFELKTLLVRCIANLLYKNSVNKKYSVDTQLLPALLECTNIDARNPLMKEWSILALRNACIDCPEVQQVIASLTNQGLAKNNTVTELNLDMGSLRISPCKD